MKTRILLLLTLIALLLLNTGTGALSAPRYQVGNETSGGNYQLTSLQVQAGPISAGGTYRLVGQSAPNLQASGCCCTWLPCVLNNY